jgi:hypothetical protein
MGKRKTCSGDATLLAFTISLPAATTTIVYAPCPPPTCNPSGYNQHFLFVTGTLIEVLCAQLSSTTVNDDVLGFNVLSSASTQFPFNSASEILTLGCEIGTIGSGVFF